MKKLAGNWKMNGSKAALAEVTALLAAHPAPGCEMLLCPPATLISQMADPSPRERPLWLAVRIAIPKLKARIPGTSRLTC